MMTNQTPVENLLALLRTQGPTIKLRTAAEIEALCDRVAILGPTSRELVTAIEATWLCGACIVMLPLPMRMA